MNSLIKKKIILGSAVATELLSRKDSKTLVIFGAGMQVIIIGV